MHFGLFSTNAYACSYPDVVAGVARAAEAAGLESLWSGEHVVLPDPQAPPSPMAPQDRILDPAVALTYCAAVTTRVRLGTGIIILPQRNPLVLAKELASLDALSNGRLIFGIGVGYLEPEFRALGAPFERARRGHRRLPGRDAGALEPGQARLSGTLRVVRRHPGASAAGAAPASADRGRRPHGRRLPPRGPARQRLVRLRAGRGRDGPGLGGPARRRRSSTRGRLTWGRSRSASRRGGAPASTSPPPRSSRRSACTA